MARCVSCVGEAEEGVGESAPEFRVEDGNRAWLQDGLAAQRSRHQLCDVILRADGASFPAHRCVLAAASPYFRSMFEEYNFTESLTREVELHSVGRDALSALLDLVYTGTLHLTAVNVHTILAAADHLLLTRAKAFCAEFLRTILISPAAPREVLKIQKSAELFLLPDLLQSTGRLIAQQLPLVVKSSDFLELDADEVVRLLSRDSIQEKESVVWAAAMTWLRHDVTARTPHVEAVLGCVRFPLLDARFLVEVVGREEVVTRSPQCMKGLHEAMCYQLLPARQGTMQSLHTRPRVGGQEGLVYCLAGSQYFLVYAPAYNRWYSLQSPAPSLTQDPDTSSLEQGQLQFCPLVVDGSVYAVVQSRSMQEVAHFRLKALLRYEASSNSWTKQRLPSHHSYNTLIGCQGALYACSRRGIEVFDRSSDSWSLVSSTRLSPCHFVVSDGSEIFCYSLQEGVVEVLDVALRTTHKHQMMTQSLYVDKVLGVAMLPDHEVFLSLRTFSGGIIRRILNIKTQQWKDVLLCHGVSPLPQPGVHFPLCLDPAELWEVTCDGRKSALYVLGLKSTISDIPCKPTASSKLDLSKHCSTDLDLDGVLPFFRMDQRDRTWKRLACLPEWICGSNPRLCVSDGQVSMATLVP